MREINPIPIPMKRRSKEEIKAYLDGFEAGVKLCTDAINENAQRFRELVVPTIGGGEGECIKTQRATLTRHPEKH